MEAAPKVPRCGLRYFDHNATYPLAKVAREAWLDAADRYIGNPSSPHRLGDRAEKALNEARERASDWLGCRPEEVIWTSGATESVNTALAHLAATREGDFLLSPLEHPCVREAANRCFIGRVRPLGVHRNGIVEIAEIEGALRRGSIAGVALMAANNETGVLQPWREAQLLCAQAKVPFLCDAAQWVGRMPARGLGAGDFVSGCAHKFGGPVGVGFLKAPLELRPLLMGGAQEAGRRAGTENVPGVLAMIAAWAERERATPDPTARDVFVQELIHSIPEAKIVGYECARLWNTASVIMPEAWDCRQRWVVRLDRLGFAVSTGSACSSGKEEPSATLSAMGFTPSEAGRALRFSSGWETAQGDWTDLLSAVRAAAAALCGTGA